MQRPFTGVRSIALELDGVLDRCRAYEPLLREGEVFSHATAASLFGLPMPAARIASAGRVCDPIEVTAAPGFARARSAGVRGHVSTKPLAVVFHLGLPVVRPAIAWCQLAGRVGLADLVALGDALITGRRKGVQRAPALVSPDELVEAVRWWGRRRGALALGEALGQVRVGAESRPESHLRLLLVNAGLPEPLPNDATDLGDGQVLHPDLKFPHARVVLEYQGDHHRTDRAQWQADVRRRRAFERAGWCVIEVTADDLYVDSSGLIDRVWALVMGADVPRRGPLELGDRRR